MLYIFIQTSLIVRSPSSSAFRPTWTYSWTLGSLPKCWDRFSVYVPKTGFIESFIPEWHSFFVVVIVNRADISFVIFPLVAVAVDVIDIVDIVVDVFVTVAVLAVAFVVVDFVVVDFVAHFLLLSEMVVLCWCGFAGGLYGGSGDGFCCHCFCCSRFSRFNLIYCSNRITPCY